MQEITARLRLNPGVTSIPSSLGTITLTSWESQAFVAEHPEIEQSFRAECSRSITHAIGLISRIGDEVMAYQETKGIEYRWKPHYDALVYLLYRGRHEKETLLRLAEESRRRGLPDKSKQLLSTSGKLEPALSTVASILSEYPTDSGLSTAP